MSEPFPHLFAPLRIGPLAINNRIMNTGHAAHFQTGEGLPAERYADYLGERARGGVGIVVTGHTVSHHDGDTPLSFANFDRLCAQPVPVHAVGDCFQPRDIEVAVVDGHRAARAIV